MISDRLLAIGGLGLSLGFVIGIAGLFAGEVLGPSAADAIGFASVMMICVAGIIAILGGIRQLVDRITP